MASVAAAKQPAPATLSDTIARSASELDIRRVQQRLFESLWSAATPEEAHQRFVDFVRELLNAETVVYFTRSETGKLAPAATANAHDLDPNDLLLYEALLPGAVEAVSKSCLQVSEIRPQPRRVQLFVPVHSADRPMACVSAVLAVTWEPIEPFAVALQLVAGYMAMWQIDQRRQSSADEAFAAAVALELATRIAGCGTLRSACQLLANGLAKYLAGSRVAVAFGPRGKAAVRALSGLQEFDAGADLVRAIKAVLADPELPAGVVSTFDTAHSGHGSSPVRQDFRRFVDAESLVTSQLTDAQGQEVGALIVWGSRGRCDTPSVRGFLEAAARPLGTSLDAVRRAERTRLVRGLQSLRRSSPQSRLALTAALVACGIALLIPWPHRIGGDCHIEPVGRRSIAVPYDGILQETLVAPGDAVTAGQTLARMDAVSLKLELEALKSDRDRAAKKRDTSLAARQIAEAEMARLDVEALDLRVRLLQRRLKQRDIRSPEQGVLLSGDLKPAEGASLKQGTTLFEIAPLEKLLVEIALEESDLEDVQGGQSVAVDLRAFPGRTWPGHIARIRPEAEIWESRHVFVAEVVIGNDDGQLRPGMHGTARIAAAARSWGSRLLRKASSWL